MAETDRSRGEGRSGRRDPRDREQYTGNYKRLFINLGKSDGFYPEQLIELVNSNTKGTKSANRSDRSFENFFLF